MQNLSDDELDNMFRKAADDLRPPYDPDHWKELDAKLSASTSPRSSRAGWIVSIVALVLLSGSVYVWRSSSNYSNVDTATLAQGDNIEIDVARKSDVDAADDNSINQSTQHRDTVDRNEKSSADKDEFSESIAAADGKDANETGSAVITNRSNEVALPDNGYAKRTQKENRTNVSSIIDARRVNQTPPTVEGSSFRTNVTKLPPEQIRQSEYEQTDNTIKDVDKVEDENSVAPQHNTTVGRQDDQTSDSNAIAGSNERNSKLGQENQRDDVVNRNNDVLNSEKGVTENQEALTVQSFEGNGQVSKAATPVASDSTIDKVNQESGEIDGTITETENEKKQEENREPRFALKLALSPDFSAVKYSGFTKAGSNYGIIAEYRFADRWSIASGVIWSRKIYSASDVEYGTHTAYKADGDCRIMDIPLNVYYQFRKRGTLSLYGGVGLSSYLMNSEEYVFHVRGTYGNSYEYETKVEGKNNEMFSIINLSIGIQKQLNSRMALQFEPFVKQPVKGIGEGDLSLSTVGAFLNLRFSIVK